VLCPSEVHESIEPRSIVRVGKLHAFILLVMTTHFTLCDSCSNIAIKVNTKLFSKGIAARAWDIQVNQIEGGIPWLEQVPTLVMGLTLTRGKPNSYIINLHFFLIHFSIFTAGGADSKTIVTGSVCLTKRGDVPGTVPLAMDIRVQKSAGVVEALPMYMLSKVRYESNDKDFLFFQLIVPLCQDFGDPVPATQ
jgi:hypothetical protein